MGGGTTKRIEAGVAAFAAATLAGAVGFAAFSALQGTAAYAAAACAALVAFAGCWRLLGSIARHAPDYPVATFDLGTVDAPEDVLELVDVLEQVDDDSRVVRLFDPSAMPTPSELKARIDRHLERGSPPGASPDASQALVDALTELRRSLR
ncbi:MAG: hypothetical protein V4513_01000 [Pseudomonadota bacterium]